MARIFAYSILFLALAAAPLAAQSIFHTGDGAIDGRLCVGTSCDGTAADNLGQAVTLRLRQFQNSISVDDTTDPTSSNPSNDWDLMFNSAISEFFGVRDATSGAIPFVVEAGAGQNALYVASDNQVGFGTSIPQRSLHVVSNFDAALRLQSTNIPFNPVSFDLLTSRDGFELVAPQAGGLVPFAVSHFTPTDALLLKTAEMVVNDSSVDYDFRVRGTAGTTLFSEAETGYVGIGTSSPGAPLTVSSPDTFTFFRIEALGATPNTAADMTYTQGPTGNGEYRINVVDGDGPEMRVNAEGYVIATTGFRVGSTDLTVPDYVFEPDYALRPLAEVASFIKQNKHLPDVPSAGQVAEQGLDMTQMQMTLLKKVEELTLYTLELEAARAAQEANNATLLARLEALERHITAD